MLNHSSGRDDANGNSSRKDGRTPPFLTALSMGCQYCMIRKVGNIHFPGVDTKMAIEAAWMAA